MGGGQSQERVVGVEEGAEGGPQIIITEDFVKLIGNKSESGALSDNERSTRENLENRNELNEDVFNPSAEQLVKKNLTLDHVLLVGERYSRNDDAIDRDDDGGQWKRKFDMEQQKNSSLKTLSSEAFDEAVNEIRDKFSSKASNDVMPVCEECRDSVDQCYQQNSARPLVCSNLVTDYVQCVEKYRKGLLQSASEV